MEIIFDLETTGTDYATDAITQFTFLKKQTGEYFASLVNPKQPISLGAIQTTGITNVDVEFYPPFEHFIPQILDFIGDEPVYLIAHNGDRFDKLLLFRFLRSNGYSIPSTWKFIDTLKLSRIRYPMETSHRMDSLRERFQLSTKNNHSANKDVFDLAIIYDGLKQNDSPEKLHEMSLHYVSFGKHRGSDFRTLPTSYIDYLIRNQVYLYQEDVFCYLQSTSQIPKKKKLYRKLSWNKTINKGNM